MALILEIRGASGAPTWHRLDALPLTLGRGLSNDIILDDPYLDARHARIALDERGTLSIDDLGTVNGLYANHRRALAASLHPGAEVRIGRTVLRFRDADEAIAPALVDDRATMPSSFAPPQLASAVPFRRTPASFGAWLSGSVPGRLLAIAATLGAFAVNTWLGDTSRSSGSAVLGVVFMLVAVTFVWAAVWTFAGRGAERKPSFLGHVALVSLALLVVLLGEVAKEWIDFFFPGAKVTALLYLALYLAIVAALVAGHLALSSSLSRRLRWRAGFMVSGMIIVLVALAALVKDDKFTDVSKFDAVIKPVSARWIPTESVGEFSGEMRQLRKEVDAAAKKPVEP